VRAPLESALCRRITICTLAALAVAAPLAAQRHAPNLGALTDEAFRLLNVARRDAGIDALQRDDNLSLLAQRHSQEQANRARVSHHSTEFGLSTERRVRISYPNVPRLAENIARNSTVERLHEGLLHSPGHRRNRLDPEFTHVGIGIAWDGTYSLYLTEVFVTAPNDGPLGEAVALYFEAEPGSYERRDNPRVEEALQTLTIGPPGPDDPEYWTDRGINSYNEGDLAGAEQAFRHALELKADYHYAEYNLARVLISRGDSAAAVELLDGLIERDPADLDAIATRGTAALFMEQYEPAAEFFRRVLRLRPEDASAWYNLALSLEFLDRNVDAETAYREALRLDPQLTAAKIGLARVVRR